MDCPFTDRRPKAGDTRTRYHKIGIEIYEIIERRIERWETISVRTMSPGGVARAHLQIQLDRLSPIDPRD